MVMAAAMGGPPRRSDGPEVAATTMAGVTIAIGALTQWGEAPQLAAFFIWAKRACRLLADIVAKVENRTTQKISRKLIFGLLCGCVAL